MEEYTRKINRGYQFTLPQSFRDAYDLDVGDYLRVYEENGKLIIEPVTIMPKNPVDALEQLFGSADSNFSDLSEEEIMRLIRKEIKKQRKKNKD